MNSDIFSYMFLIFVVVSVSHTHWLGWVLRKRTKIPFRRCGRPHAFEILVLLVVPSEMFSLQIAGSTSCHETHPLQSWLGQSGHAGLWFSSESKYEHTKMFFHFHVLYLSKEMLTSKKKDSERVASENLVSKRSLQKPQLSVRAPANIDTRLRMPASFSSKTSQGQRAFGIIHEERKERHEVAMGGVETTSLASWLRSY